MAISYVRLVIATAKYVSAYSRNMVQGSISADLARFCNIWLDPRHRGTAYGDVNWRWCPSFDPPVGDVPKIVGNELDLVRVVDALNFGTRDSL
jgi:hypothetical protein